MYILLCEARVKFFRQLLVIPAAVSFAVYFFLLDLIDEFFISLLYTNFIISKHDNNNIPKYKGSEW